MRLKECQLFKGTRFDYDDAQIRQLPNDFILFREGDKSQYVGIVLTGKIHVRTISISGEVFLINTLTPGELFGDVLLFSKEHNFFPGDLVTVEDSTVALISNKVFKQYLFHDKDFLNNFLILISEKALDVNIKNKMLSQSSVREKILFYLHRQKVIQNSNKIALKMTKKDLASLLFIPRPSLSRELINMKKDGLITYDRKSITLLQK
ncbi:MAG: Crp/Fnr family transcriptional regulator [Candidatus Izimaplasma sp.]|nr:Crp/Fnr family transcriptional regulator [Candidatus Izimaplasma bacterium]